MYYSDSILKIAADPYIYWIKKADDGVIEFYLDNHMLQTFRACEARGIEEFVNGRTGTGRVWFLDFGTVVHDLMEIYYSKRYESGFDIMDFCGKVVPDVWHKRDMDYYAKSTDKFINSKCVELGGMMGLMLLMTDYTSAFRADTERFRVVGAELLFGRAKEVPLHDAHTSTEFLDYSTFPYRIYLCGKIDLLMDDGTSIGPMDHKTSSNFMGKNPILNYEIQDGMTGYVYASRYLVQKLNIGRRDVNKIWMNFLQVKPEQDSAKRFRRIPLFKTDEQLEMYRRRQISTVHRIYTLLSNPELEPFYNTMMCSNFMHHQCAFYDAHRQNSRDDQLKILNTTFKKREKLWNPEDV
jgi:hypothetical protein